MNRSSLSLVALAAAYTLGSCKKLTAYTDGTGVAMLSIDDETDPTSGAGGTDIKQPDGAGGSEEAKEAIVDSNAGTGQQMQAQTSDAVAPGSELSTKAGIGDANKVNDGSDAGLASTAIKDPPASEQQV